MDSADSDLRPEVAGVARSALDALQHLTDALIERDPPTDGQLRAAWKLTVAGMVVVQQHARGAVAEFSAGRSYSGIALDRCMFEAMVRTMDWALRPDFAQECLTALPVFTTREEVRRAGSDPRIPLVKNTSLPVGVQRDIIEYLAKFPSANDAKEPKFSDAVKRIWAVTGVDDGELLADTFNHVDTPSLFVHCRSLVVTDVFEVTDDAWTVRDVSRIAEPNVRVLELVRLLAQFCRVLALRFGEDLGVIERFYEEWQAALASHDAVVARRIES